jgi:hypothetical protein
MLMNKAGENATYFTYAREHCLEENPLSHESEGKEFKNNTSLIEYTLSISEPTEEIKVKIFNKYLFFQVEEVTLILRNEDGSTQPYKLIVSIPPGSVIEKEFNTAEPIKHESFQSDINLIYIAYGRDVTLIK